MTQKLMVSSKNFSLKKNIITTIVNFYIIKYDKIKEKC
jgi:hypothetical protein